MYPSQHFKLSMTEASEAAILKYLAVSEDAVIEDSFPWSEAEKLDHTAVVGAILGLPKMTVGVSKGAEVPGGVVTVGPALMGKDELGALVRDTAVLGVILGLPTVTVGPKVGGRLLVGLAAIEGVVLVPSRGASVKFKLVGGDDWGRFTLDDFVVGDELGFPTL